MDIPIYKAVPIVNHVLAFFSRNLLSEVCRTVLAECDREDDDDYRDNFCTIISTSQVCRLWRHIVVGDEHLWRNLVVTTKDHNPEKKVAAFVKRCGASGLSYISFDMTYDFDRPSTTAPVRTSPRNYKASTFQKMIYAIDKATKRGVVHNLDMFSYYSEQFWFGMDMTYLIRLLIRPYIQPRTVRIHSEDNERATFGPLKEIPLLPAFNHRLESFHVIGRGDVRYHFTPQENVSSPIPLSARLHTLYICGISSEDGYDRAYDRIVLGLYALSQARETYQSRFIEGVDLTYESCAPGESDKAAIRYQSMLDGWTDAPSSYSSRALDCDSEPRKQEKGSELEALMDVTSDPLINLPGLRKLFLGLDSFRFLRRLRSPNLEMLCIDTPLWFDYKCKDRLPTSDKIIQGFIKHGGFNLEILDLSKSCLGHQGLISPQLQADAPKLRMLAFANPVSVDKDVVPYLRAKETSGTKLEYLLAEMYLDKAPKEQLTYVNDSVDKFLCGRDWLKAQDERRMPYWHELSDLHSNPCR